MGTKNNPGSFDCYANAKPDEPLFVLLARDASAPELVERWAKGREDMIRMGHKPESDRAMVDEARACAQAMRRYHNGPGAASRNQTEAQGLVEYLTAGSYHDIYQRLADQGAKDVFVRFKKALIERIATALDRRLGAATRRCGLHDAPESEALVCARCVEITYEETKQLLEETAQLRDERTRAMQRAVEAIQMAKSFVECVVRQSPNERWPRMILDGLAAVLEEPA